MTPKERQEYIDVCKLIQQWAMKFHGRVVTSATFTFKDGSTGVMGVVPADFYIDDPEPPPPAPKRPPAPQSASARPAKAEPPAAGQVGGTVSDK